jgi:circadian clock protein KaiB
MNDAGGVTLFLFVASGAPRSNVAIENIQRALLVFGERLFVLEIVNVHDEPDRAFSYRVLVTPTLLAPAFARRLVGDLGEMSQLHYFLRGLPEASAT